MSSTAALSPRLSTWSGSTRYRVSRLPKPRAARSRQSLGWRAASGREMVSHADRNDGSWQVGRRFLCCRSAKPLLHRPGNATEYGAVATTGCLSSAAGVERLSGVRHDPSWVEGGRKSKPGNLEGAALARPIDYSRCDNRQSVLRRTA